MSIVEKLASEGHLTAEQVERIGRNVRDFVSAIEKDPAFRKEAMEKLGGFGDALGKAFSREGLGRAAERTVEYLPYALATAGAGALMGGAIEAGRSGVRSLRDTVNKSRAFESMMNENPNLSEVDAGLAEKAFNTLYRFNPSYASDPLVAGTFVKNVIDQERMDIGTVSNLVQANKAISESKPRGNMSEFFMKSMQGGVRPGGGGGAGGGEGPDMMSLAKNMTEAEAARAAAERARQAFFESTEQVSSDDPRVRK